MSTIDPGQLRVVANKNGGVDVTYKSSSGHSKYGSSFNNLTSDNVEESIKNIMSGHDGKYSLTSDQQDYIRQLVGGTNTNNGGVTTQATKADADAYRPTETSHLDQATGLITDSATPGVVKYSSPVGNEGKDPISTTNTSLPKPGETVGDLFTNPDTNQTFNWKTGELVSGTAPTNTTSSTPSNPFSTTLTTGSSGADVSNLQKILNAQGANLSVDGQYGAQTAAAVKAYQASHGLTADGIFGPQTSGALTTAINGAGTPGAGSTTPAGMVDPNAPVNLTSGSSPTFDSSALGGNTTTADVMNQRQSYEDTINGYLKQQSDAYAALNDTKAQQLQGQANIMYGRNGTGGSDADLQGTEQAMFDRQMAFKTVPAEIALSNSQNALALYKQSPEYQAQQQALSTANNLIQSYPDLGITYNPRLDPEQNLQAIQSAVSNSPRFKAQNSVLATNPVTGQPYIINKLGNGGGTSVSGSNIGGGTGSAPSTVYTPGGAITKLPPGVSSTGSPAFDQSALGLYNGTVAPNQIEGTGIQKANIQAKANEISQRLTGKPFDLASAQSAYDFRQTPAYQSYVGNAPTAIRNLQGMAEDVRTLGITSNLSTANWTKIGLISKGLWLGATQTQISAATDLLSKYSQSHDDIGLLLGTGTGSDAKLAIGGMIFQPNGSVATTDQLANSVSNTILSKLGDKYRQAGVKDPTPFLSSDTATIYNSFKATGSGAITAPTSSAAPTNNAAWLTDYNYDRDIADARAAIGKGADKNAVKARLLTKYKTVNL